MDTQRCFIALPLPEKEKKRLARAVEPFRKDRGGVGWVQPGAYHMTLLFLGDLTPREVLEVKEALLTVPDWGGSFPVAYDGIGTFPPRGAPRVLYTPFILGGGDGGLYRLIKQILPGFKGDRRFTPHLTLGRVRRRGLDREERLLFRAETSPLQPKGRFRADRIVLYESIRERSGAIYRELLSLPLEGSLPSRTVQKR